MRSFHEIILNTDVVHEKFDRESVVSSNTTDPGGRIHNDIRRDICNKLNGSWTIEKINIFCACTYNFVPFFQKTTNDS